jgi:hypothetical protein
LFSSALLKKSQNARPPLGNVATVQGDQFCIKLSYLACELLNASRTTTCCDWRTGPLLIFKQFHPGHQEEPVLYADQGTVKKRSFDNELWYHITVRCASSGETVGRFLRFKYVRRRRVKYKRVSRNI